MPVKIRTATKDDLVRITEIYGNSVLTETASFETEPPSIDEMGQRFTKLTNDNYPYLVAEFDGRIAGYAYAGAYRARAAYYWSVEDAIYLDPEYHGRGIGKALLLDLLDNCTEAGFRQIIGVIATDDKTPNLASIALHETCGFETIGNIKNVGRKHGIWLDTVIMQKALGEGGATPPSSEA
ncbi:MAG: GNAT family N-acetyltransferase [Hyphomicrobiales bacterium]|nr:MAG: GNAT family N-acetyltransferase [Hyphomicrobiales bacterium]